MPLLSADWHRAVAAILDYRPYPGQAQLHNSNALFRVAVFHRQYGKSRAGAAEVCFHAIGPNPKRHQVLVLAEEDELLQPVWTEVMHFATQTPFARFVSRVSDSPGRRHFFVRNVTGGLTQVRGTSARASSKRALGAGFIGWPYLFVLIDEAALLNPEVLGLLTPGLGRSRGRCLLSLTPRGRNHAYLWYQWGLSKAAKWRHWAAFKVTAYESGVLDAAFLATEHQRYIAQGEEWVFEQEYLCEFVSGGGNVYRNVRANVAGVFEEPVPGKQYVFGFDYAQKVDFAVLHVMDLDGHLVHVYSERGIPSPDIADEVARITSLYGNAHGLVDETGAGAPFCDMLRQRGVRFEGVTFNRTNKAHLIQALKLALIEQEVTFPAAAVELLVQLEAFTVTEIKGGGYRYEAPTGMHDDEVIALALCNAARVGRPADLPAPLAFSRPVEEDDLGIERGSDGGLENVRDGALERWDTG